MPQTNSLSSAAERPDVALIISDLGLGGAQRVVVRLSAHWLGQGRRVAVITQAPVEDDFFHLPSNVKRVVAGGLGSSKSLIGRVVGLVRRTLLMRRAIRRADAPVLISFVGRTAITSIFARLGMQNRLIISERNDPSQQSLGGFWDFLRRHFYRYAHVVTANTTEAIDVLENFVPREKLAYVPNPVSIPEAEPAGARELAFLAVGRLVHQKGFDLLIGAFAEVAVRLPNWQLWIVGGGELEPVLRTMAKDLEIDSRIVWVGVTEETANWYRRASVFVLPSRFEGTPNALLEAMSYGLPAVVTDASPGPLSLTIDGLTGYVARSGSIGRIAESMFYLGSNASARRDMGEAARTKLVTEMHSVYAAWDEAIERAQSVR